MMNENFVPAGLFAVTCPQCGIEMGPSPARAATYADAKLTYLTRDGHLLSVGHVPAVLDIEQAVVAASVPIGSAWTAAL